MPVYSLDGLVPVVHPSAFVHPQAVLLGDVIIGAHCYVGPGASLRGDFGRIIMSAGANVQDCCVLHSFPDKDALLEEEAHIGHAAVLHGCTIRRGALIGIGAILMDGAIVEEEAFVGAASFVREAELAVDAPPFDLELGRLGRDAGRPEHQGVHLTAAELRLLPLLATHLSFPEIAGEMFLSRHTVKSQAISIYRKLGASSRSQAITLSRELGLQPIILSTGMATLDQTLIEAARIDGAGFFTGVLLRDQDVDCRDHQQREQRAREPPADDRRFQKFAKSFHNNWAYAERAAAMLCSTH